MRIDACVGNRCREMFKELKVHGGVYKMKPKKAKNLIYFLCIIGFIMILFSYSNIIFLPIGLLVAGSSIVPNLLFYKCPHCGKHLGRSSGDFCQYCGKSIDN